MKNIDQKGLGMTFAMRRTMSIVLVLCCSFLFCGESQETPAVMQVEVRAQSVGKMKILLVCISRGDEKTAWSKDIMRYLQKDLEFTGQFAVESRQLSEIPTKEEFAHWRATGYEIALFIEKSQKTHAYDWRLYDLSGPTMIKGKRCEVSGSVMRCWAHALADAVWPEITGDPGFFSTRIAYCKDIKDKHARAVKHICIADYDGGHEQVIVDTHTLNVAPRWNVDAACPLVFFSEHTSSNVRLMMAGMDKKRHVVVNFDGLTMLPSFSDDGKKVVFCASRGDGVCDMYCFEQGVLKRLTQNQGNNIAPVFAEHGNVIYFCSDRSGTPHIYSYHVPTKTTEQITFQGYCVSPAYNAKKQRIAYAKMVQGAMQLFVYDITTKHHRQITFDAGDKEECSWSVCGNYLTYAHERGLKSRIAMIHVDTSEKRFLTAAHENCSYPTWSPVYRNMPVVANETKSGIASCA